MLMKVKKILLVPLALLFFAACGNNNDKNPVSSREESGISDLKVEVNPGEAIITWKTPVASSTEIKYGSHPTYGFFIINSELALDHRVELKELFPESLYYAQIGEKAFTFITSSEGLRIRIAPALRQVKKGQEFELEVRVEEVSALFGTAVKVYFDGSILEAVKTEPGEFLGSDILYIEDVDSSTVGIGTTMKKGNIGRTGSGVIARVVFGAKSEGATEVNIGPEDLKLKESDGSMVSGFNKISVGQAQIIVEKQRVSH